MCMIYGNFNQALTRKRKILHSRKRSQTNYFPTYNYSNKIPCNYDDNGSFLVAQMVNNLLNNSGDLGLITGLGRSPWEGNGNPLQYSYLENSIEEPSGLLFLGSQRVGNYWVTNTTGGHFCFILLFYLLFKKINPFILIGG